MLRLQHFIVFFKLSIPDLYKVEEDKLIIYHKSLLWFSKESQIFKNKISSITYTRSFLGWLFNYGDVTISIDEYQLVLTDVKNVKDFISQLS